MNKVFIDAKKNKEDEFYTQLKDIDDELKHYKRHFKGKVVYCNCDDPRVSRFFEYFTENFEILGLRKLITTCYRNQSPTEFSKNADETAVYLEYEGDKNKNKIVDDEEVEVLPLKGDGDFRSEECILMLKKADIVVTNPPFSLFREYVSQLMEYKKKFLIIGNMNAISYKDMFPFIMNNRMWLGNNLGSMEFKVPSHYPPRKSRYWQDETGQKWRSMGNTCWFTNLEHTKRNELLPIYKEYTKEDYPTYDNCDAIEVSKTKNIPKYTKKMGGGAMGGPVSFLDKWNPEQFEILGMDDHTLVYPAWRGRGPDLNGKPIYRRIIIRHKKT